MKKQFLKIAAVLIAAFCTADARAQSMSINSTGTKADTSAILDLGSTTRGLLIPRMTAAQKNAIVTPATGLLIYQTDGSAGFYYYNGTGWYLLVTSAVNTDRQNTLIYTVKGF